MTKDDIIRMARETGFQPLFPNDHVDGGGGVYVSDDEMLERFFHAAYAAGAKAEQEACKDACTRYVNSTNDRVALTALNILDAMLKAREAK